MAMLPNPVEQFAALFGMNRQPAPLLPKLAKEQGVDFAAKLGALQRQLEEARALKAKGLAGTEAGSMVSGHYVPNYGGMIGNAIGGLVGGMRQKDLETQAAEVAAAQQAAQADLLANMPQGQAAIPEQAMGPGLPVEMGGGEGTVEGPAPMQPGQAAKAPTQQEIMAWAGKMSAVNPKLADMVTGKVVEGQMETMFPDKQKPMQVAGGVYEPATGQFKISPEYKAEQEARREERKQLLEIRAAQLDWQKENANLNREQKEELARQSAELRRELKSMGGSGGAGPGTLVRSGEVDGNGRPIFINNKTGAESLAGGKAIEGNPMPPAAFEKEVAAAKGAEDAYRATSNLLSEAKRVGADTMGRPAAMVGKLPRIIGAPIESAMLTSEQKQFRANAMRYGAQERHALYGAALTAGEAALADKFIIAADDDMPTVLDKIKGIERVQKQVRDRLSKTGPGRVAVGRAEPAGAAGGSDEDVLNKYLKKP